MAYAIVQFTHSLDDDTLMCLRNFRQRCGTSYLKFWDQKDIVPNPRTYDNVMEGVTLNLGCQVSQDEFSVLWNAADVCVKFGTGLKVMHLLLCHELVEYRLQLYYDSIWQIVLYDSGIHAPKMLLIQHRESTRSLQTLSIAIFSELQMINGSEQPILPHHCVSDNLPGYVSSCLMASNFLILKDTLYTTKKVCCLVQTGCLPGAKLDENFYQLLNPERFDIAYLEQLLEKLYYLKKCCYDPHSWLIEQHQSYCSFKKLKSPVVDADVVHIHKVQVTPTKVYFHGPEVNVSNRVLRNFHDHIDNFLRVSFVEEDWSKMYASDLSPRGAGGDESTRTKLYDRILSTLRNGITIGSKKFEFLAFSSKTLTVAQNEVKKIPDVELVRDGTTYIFSDGIGKISVDFARRVAIKCGLRSNIPSAFQIRYGGYEGVVAVDPTSSVKMSLRPSMLKYQSDDTKLNVLGWSKYQPCFLNRQIITLLSTLGVADHVFEKKQSEAVARLNDIIVDPFKALEALDLMSLGENTYILKEMLKCGYKPDEEPFLAMMLQTLRSSQLLDLRTKSRIFIRQARNMMGCLDETATLEYGQVFVQFSSAEQRRFYEESIDEYSSTDHNYVVKGKVAVAKNPCLHPGDLRVLEAIDVPALHHMVNCIVFPHKGMRGRKKHVDGLETTIQQRRGFEIVWFSSLPPKKNTKEAQINKIGRGVVDVSDSSSQKQHYYYCRERRWKHCGLLGRVERG
ncbi:hypothetical protein SASPL_105983 [Salvia splendens]|uniref:RNA-dependent RNA polymerase n=1 Tax=Salvia splendens TaxID=180675 RepID=A0A8X9AAH5_SALSN|nr:hypothetical protein SASPL_105983 [Salvia splendens]